VREVMELYSSFYRDPADWRQLLEILGLGDELGSQFRKLRRISDFTPLGAGVQSLADATAGQWPQLLHVAVMVGWTVLAGGLAARFFRWE
jgi:hypothetical protein